MELTGKLYRFEDEDGRCIWVAGHVSKEEAEKMASDFATSEGRKAPVKMTYDNYITPDDGDGWWQAEKWMEDVTYDESRGVA